MPRQSRCAMFETNSSSTHSIFISDGDLDDSLFVEDGVCEVHPGEFGWEVEDYDDAATKASYCLTHAKQRGSVEMEEMLLRVVTERTGASEVRFVPSNDKYYEWGYIDHQSSDVCDAAFASDGILSRFIFSSHSRLHTDNDNH